MITAADRIGDTVRNRAVDSLCSIADPCSIATGRPINLVDMGLVERVDVDSKGAVTVVLWPTSPVCLQLVLIREAVEKEIGGIQGVTAVRCEVDYASEWTPSRVVNEAFVELRQIRPVPIRENLS